MRARRTAAVASLALGLGVAPLAHSAPGLRTTRLANTVVPNLAAAQRISAVPAGQKLQVVVGLSRPHEADERRLAAAVYTPGNPAFHRFLTPAQYAARFGVDRATYRHTIDWLTRDGMQIVYVSPDRSHISLGGTAAQAQRTFDVPLFNYRLGSFEFRAHPTPALVPASVVAIQGLQTASSYRLSPHAVPSGQGNPCVQGICTGALAPADLWKVYGMGAAGLSQGTGARAAVIGEGKTSTTIAGLRWFELANSLRQVPTRSVFVANDKTVDDGAAEWQIDSQAITGMAPDLQELSFYMAQSLPVVSNAISAWVNDPAGPSIANMSIGGCETLNLALGSPLIDEPLLRQGALEGRTLFVSTGDTGGSCAVFPPLVPVNGILNTGVPSAQWPSSSEYVVGVGGTVLYTTKATGARFQEYTWTHSGGGVSTFIPSPAWQRALAQIKAPCSTDYKVNPVTSYVPCRAVPDVAALSGDLINGYTTYTDKNATFPGGGTSLSAPLWAGMWARVQSTIVSPLGLASPILYQKAIGGALDAFSDVFAGSNVQWHAEPRTPANLTGWDYTSGFGAPVVSALATAVTGRMAAARANVAPAKLDTDVTMGAAGGGGTVSACVTTGRYTDPSGDATDFGTGKMTDVDLTAASISRSDTNIVFTGQVVNLAATPEAKEYSFGFAFAGATFQLDVLKGFATNSWSLWSTPSYTNLKLTGVTVNFNTSTNTVTATMPIANFNNVSAVRPLVPGDAFTGVTIKASYEAGPGVVLLVPINIDDIDATGCPAAIL